MSTALQPTDIDTLRADLAGLERRAATLRQEQTAPALRANSARRQAISHELTDLAVLIADAKIAVLEAQIVELETGYAPFYASRSQAQIDAQHALDVLIPAAKQGLSDAQAALYAGQGSYQQANNNIDSLSRQVATKRQEIAAIRAGGK